MRQVMTRCELDPLRAIAWFALSVYRVPDRSVTSAVRRTLEVTIPV
jgi:hypothetical protein